MPKAHPHDTGTGPWRALLLSPTGYRGGHTSYATFAAAAKQARAWSETSLGPVIVMDRDGKGDEVARFRGGAQVGIGETY